MESNIKSFTSNFSTGLLITPINVLSSVFIARLGADSKGVYSFVLLFFSYCIPVFSFGIPGGIKYFISKGKYDISSILFSVIVLAFMLGLFTAAVFLFLWKMDWLGEIGQKLEFFHVAFLTLLCIPYVLSIALNKLLEGAGLFAVRNYIFIFHVASLAALLCYFVVVENGDVYDALLVFAVNHVVNALLLLTYVLRKNTMLWRLNFNYIKDSLHYGIKVWPTEQLGRHNNKMDQVILGLLYPASFLGVYSVAFAFCDLINLFALAFFPIYFNKMARAKQQKVKISSTLRILRITVTFHLLMSLLIVASGYFLIPLVYGSVYEEAAKITWMVIPCFLFYNFAKVIIHFFSAIDRPILGSKIQIIGRLGGIPFFFVFIYLFGAKGAALANVASAILMTTLAWYYFKKRFQRKASFPFFIHLADWHWMKALLQQRFRMLS